MDSKLFWQKMGLEGFEKFKKDDVDLCILDVMMPYKDGFTLAKEIREKSTEIPIIFFNGENHERRCFERLQGWGR